MLSIQTNVNALVAEQNLNINSKFQSNTIEQLTSGYRINNAGDDAAGLAVANQLRDSTSELTQGVANGNDAVAQLQIMDSGMSNISQILDRLKTLATQSASGTFTGNRTTLNQEFQSDIQEIDREAQSMGLDTGGTFAKSLSVYLGQGSGSQNLANAQVGVDLSTSTVDSQSLGLKGMQAVVGGADLGSSSATSVASILANTTNNNSGALTSTNFLLSGPGMSTNGNPLALNVNLTGVATIEDLVTNINAAIQTASNGSTAADAALKSAGIVASVNTDANGGEQLAFTSSTTAFQVQAGDQMANALMGNFSSGTTGATVTNSVTGTGVVTTADQAATMAATQGASVMNPANINFTISGAGMSSADTINLQYTSAVTVGRVIQDLQTALSGSDPAFKAGITASVNTTTNQLSFNNANGQQFQVQVAGDTQNQLGLGAFASSGTTSADYNSITAATAYNPNGTLGVNQQTTLELSIAGQSAISLGSIALDGGDASAASVTSGTVNPTTIVAGVPATPSTYTAGAAAGTGYTPQNYSTTFGDINVTINGVQHDVKLHGNDQTFTELQNDLQSGLDATAGNGGFGTGALYSSGVKVSASSGQLVLTSQTPGTGHDITAVGAGTTHDALAALGFNGSDTPVTGTAGSGNSIVNFAIDGHAIDFNLQADLAAVAGQITGGSTISSDGTTLTSPIDFTTPVAATQATITGTATPLATDSSFAEQNYSANNGEINITSNASGANQTRSILLTGDDTSFSALKSDLQNALDNGTSGFGDGGYLSSGIQVGDDGSGHITLTAVAAGANTITVNALGSPDGSDVDATSALTFTAAQTNTGNAATTTPAPKDIEVSYGGNTKDISFGSGTISTVSGLETALQNALNAATGSGGFGASTFTVGMTNNKLTITANTAGANSAISIGPGITNNAYSALGLTSWTTTQTAAAASITSLASMAQQINTAITTAQTSGSLEGTGSGATASVVGSTIQIVNSQAGADHSIAGLTTGVGYFGDSSTWGTPALTNATSGTAYGVNRSATSLKDAINQNIAGNSTLEAAGLQASLSGSNLVLSANAGVNFRVNGGAASATAQVTGSTDLTAGANFSVTPMTLKVSIDGTTHSATLNQNYANQTDLVNAINTQFGADYASMTSVNGKNYLTFTSPTANSTAGSVRVLSTGTANAALGLTDTTAHSGADEVNTGFGVSNSSSAGNLAVTAASSSLNVSDAAGTAQTGGLSFVDMSAGKQALTVTATDAGGTMQSATINLASSNGTGSDIDSAVNYINQQLQQTNNATLKSIVAVKQNVNGAEEINFMSPATPFQVSVGSTSDATGLNAGTAENVSGAITGTASTIAIDTQDGATAAIAAIGAAVSKLGSAQANVGKGENQLNYAISLAQSQITNFSAAESQIRDADVAKEAANLSKAQILQQASIAAMAQANTAPQAVLKLLQG